MNKFKMLLIKQQSTLLVHYIIGIRSDISRSTAAIPPIDLVALKVMEYYSDVRVQKIRRKYERGSFK